MGDCRKFKTSAEVWAVIRAAHPDLAVFSTYSAPDGDEFGNPDECQMMTEYGFRDSVFPLIGARTTWEKDTGNEHNRINEQTEYWLCVGETSDD